MPRPARAARRARRTRPVVVRNACVQHEIVAAARDGNRIELNRAEAAKDLADTIEATCERTRRREELAHDQEAPCGVCRDLHVAGGYPLIIEASHGEVDR